MGGETIEAINPATGETLAHFPRCGADELDAAVRAAAAAQLRYFAGVALQLRGDTIPGPDDRLNYTLQEPFGVVGRIIPFNHPQ